MGSKTILLLGLSFAIVLLLSSEVAAGDLGEQTSTVSNDETEAVKETNGVEEGKYRVCRGYRCRYYGCCLYGCCRYGCCRAADAHSDQVEPQN